MELGVRVAYPECGGYDWYEALKPYPAVEVAFRDPEWFLGANLEQAVCWPWEQGLRLPTVLSIHLPHIGIARDYPLSRVLEKGFNLAFRLHTKRLVVHPQNASTEEGLASLGRALSRLSFSVPRRIQWVDLCWETFLSKRRFVNDIESIAEAGLYACYDTSHMRRDSEGVLNDLFKYKDTIKVVHLSNFDEHGQHLPLREGVLDMRTILAYLGKNFGGPVILEYLRKYHHLYLDDLRWARKAGEI